MKFRNYIPHDEQLRGGKLAPVSLPKFEDPINADAAEPNQLEVVDILFWCFQIQNIMLTML